MWAPLRCRIIGHVASVSELNKDKVRLFVEAVWNEGRLDLIEELVAADYVGHLPCLALGVFGPQEVRRVISSRRRATPACTSGSRTK